MTTAGTILRAGLTGGIACGKSTVARYLSQAGAFVIDADGVAHEVIEPGRPAYDRIVALHGREILEPSGRIDRRRLGERVFSDRQALAELNAIVHPEVREEIEARLLRDATRAAVPVAVVEAALLVETGSYREYHKLIVARCDARTQLERLIERDGLSVGQARARVASQAPERDKLAVADYVIDTGGGFDVTRGRAERLLGLLLRDHRLRFGGRD